jgi:hypothetical protein
MAKLLFISHIFWLFVYNCNLEFSFVNMFNDLSTSVQSFYIVSCIDAPLSTLLRNFIDSFDPLFNVQFMIAIP